MICSIAGRTSTAFARERPSSALFRAHNAQATFACRYRSVVAIDLVRCASVCAATAVGRPPRSPPPLSADEGSSAPPPRVSARPHRNRRPAWSSARHRACVRRADLASSGKRRSWPDCAVLDQMLNV